MIVRLSIPKSPFGVCGTLVVIWSVLLQVENNVDAKLSVRSGKRSPHQAIMMRKLSSLFSKLHAQMESIDLSRKEYQELIFDPPRNYSAFVLFYNDERVCDSCPVVLRGYERIAKSFMYLNVKYNDESSSWNMESSVFFVKVKMGESYRKLFLDLDPSRPSLYYFSPAPSVKYNTFDKMSTASFESDFGMHSLERMLDWVEQTANIRIVLMKPENTSNKLSMVLATVSIAIMILFNIYQFGYWDRLVEAIKQCNYAYFLTVVIVWLISGQMYNYIRFTPLLGPHGLNLGSLVYPSTRGQYGSESVIIMVLYALIIYGVIQLIEAREQQLSENLSNMQIQGTVLAGLSCVYFGFMAVQFLSQIKTG